MKGIIGVGKGPWGPAPGWTCGAVVATFIRHLLHHSQVSNDTFTGLSGSEMVQHRPCLVK